VPICGLVIKNNRNIIIHGKNNWQFDNQTPNNLIAGTLLHCKHEVKLEVGPGVYSIELGLASVPLSIWELRGSISHQEMSSIVTRHNHIDNAASFEVGLADKNGVAVLTHHGIADLGGSLCLSVHS
jgi:lipopolysaccharide transport system ATP-binding protein